MSIVTLNSGYGIVNAIHWPLGLWTSTGITLSAMTASTHQRALLFKAPKDGNLSKFHFRTGIVGTGDDLKISFQDPNSSGTPDGTIDQYRVITIDSADDNVWKTTGIISSDGTDGGSKRAVSAGDLVCVVIEFNSYVAGNIWLQFISQSSESGRSVFWQSTDSGSSWSEVGGAFCGAVEYDDGTFAYIGDTAPVSDLTTSTINSGSTPDEYSLRFKLPFPVKAVGIKIKAASQDTTFSLYPDSGSAIVSGTPLPLNTTSTSAKTLMFSSPEDLTADTYYRIGWKPSTGTNRSIPIYSLNHADIRASFELGPNFSLGTRTDGGSWSDDTTKFIIATLLVNGFQDGGGGGSCSYGALSNGTRIIPVAQ